MVTIVVKIDVTLVLKLSQTHPRTTAVSDSAQHTRLNSYPYKRYNAKDDRWEHVAIIKT